MSILKPSELLQLLDTVLSAAKKAESESPADRDRAVDGLNALAKASVNTHILGETQAGKKVRSLSKHPDASIASAASKVVAAWKEIVRKESTGGTAATAAAAAATATDSQAAQQQPESQQPESQQPESQPESQKQEPSGTATATTTSAATVTATATTIDTSLIPTTGDTVRDKIRVNLVTALHKALGEGTEVGDATSAFDLGVAIEVALFHHHKGVNAAYKSKFRQLHFNLKDEKNPDLRRRVVEGMIPADVLIHLPPEELASDAKREENQRIREKKLFDSAPSSVKQATTDQFQCGKCKARQCTYYQMQTRSADEPMTTFVRCTNCGNAWKFC